MLMAKFDLSRLELGPRKPDRAASTPAGEAKGKLKPGKAKRLLKGDDPKSLFQQLKIDVRPPKKTPGTLPESKGMIRAKAILVPFTVPMSRQLVGGRSSGKKRYVEASLGEKNPAVSNKNFADRREAQLPAERNSLNSLIEAKHDRIQTEATPHRKNPVAGNPAAIYQPGFPTLADNSKPAVAHSSVRKYLPDRKHLLTAESTTENFRPITRSFDLTRSKNNRHSAADMRLAQQASSLNNTKGDVADLNSLLPQNKTMQHRAAVRPPTMNGRQMSRDVQRKFPDAQNLTRENTRNRKRNIILNLLQPNETKILQSRLRIGQLAPKPAPEPDLMKSKLYYMKDVSENFYKEGFEEDQFSRIVKKSVFEMFKAFRDKEDFAVASQEDVRAKTVNVKPLMKPGLPVLVLDIDETLIHARTSVEAFKDFELTVEMRLGQLFYVRSAHPGQGAEATAPQRVPRGSLQAVLRRALHSRRAQVRRSHERPHRPGLGLLRRAAQQRALRPDQEQGTRPSRSSSPKTCGSSATSTSDRCSSWTTRPRTSSTSCPTASRSSPSTARTPTTTSCRNSQST